MFRLVLIFVLYFGDKTFFNGDSTMRTASKFGAKLPNFHKIPAYVAVFREKVFESLFKIVVPFIDFKAILKDSFSNKELKSFGQFS